MQVAIYAGIGNVRTESARKAQYKGSENVLATIGKENTRKPQIIAEKQRIQAETGKELQTTRDYVLKNIRDVIDNSTNERNRLTAMSLYGDYTGDKRDKAPNQERIAALRELMSAEDTHYRQQYTVTRCHELAQGRTGPAPVPERSAEAVEARFEPETAPGATQELTGEGKHA